MLLPGRIELTTLGDVLGALHRERVFGTLHLVEPSGAAHRVHFLEGLVTGVETASPGPMLGRLLVESGALSAAARRELERCAMVGSSRPLGAMLVERGLVSEATLRAALSQQLRDRLERLERVTSARISFHPRSPRELRPVTLDAAEFLHGKPRKRARQEPAMRFETQTSECASFPRTRSDALSVLGLTSDADSRAVRAAFRRMANSVHPDRHAQASPSERAKMVDAFARASAAYHMLVA